MNQIPAAPVQSELDLTPDEKAWAIKFFKYARQVEPEIKDLMLWGDMVEMENLSKDRPARKLHLVK